MQSAPRSNRPLEDGNDRSSRRFQRERSEWPTQRAGRRETTECRIHDDGRCRGSDRAVLKNPSVVSISFAPIPLPITLIRLKGRGMGAWECGLKLSNNSLQRFSGRFRWQNAPNKDSALFDGQIISYSSFCGSSRLFTRSTCRWRDI